MSNKQKKGILERLAEGPVVGDGSICFILEKRGYCKVGAWTPEAVVEFPEAVKQLQREYLRAGADVMQTATFNASDDTLVYGVGENCISYTTSEINDAACRIASEVAAEGDALVCGSLSPVAAFYQGKPRKDVEKEFDKQVKVFQKNKVDFVVAEFFANIEEMEIAISVMKKLNIPIAATMRIGPLGDEKGVSVKDCAVRMVRSGASMVGVNCKFDINSCLKTMTMMKAGLEAENLQAYLMCQPPGYLCPETENEISGSTVLPESPFCFEPRMLTRIEVHKFTRAAWELGVRYIGGCCGMEPHHIRAIAQELIPERGKVPPCQNYSEQFGGKLMQDNSFVHGHRSTREYWYSVKPASGRPYNPALSEILQPEDHHDKEYSYPY